MQQEAFYFLRPYLSKELKCLHKAPRTFYGRFYSAVAAAVQTQPNHNFLAEENEPCEPLKQTQAHAEFQYPRIGHDLRSMTCDAFRQRYETLKPQESREDEVVTIRGMHEGDYHGWNMTW